MKNNFFYKKEYSNIYKTTSRFSEVTSQILYGEKFKILSKNKNWIKIKSLFDNYIGYIKNKNYVKIYKPTHKVYSLKAFIYRKPNNKTKSFLPFASKLSMELIVQPYCSYFIIIITPFIQGIQKTKSNIQKNN